MQAFQQIFWPLPCMGQGSIIYVPVSETKHWLPPSRCSCPQVYEFQDAQSGMLCVAQPPQGVSAASLVASALSWALGSPLRLPLEPLLTCNPDSLPRLQQTLFGAGDGQSELPCFSLDATLTSLRWTNEATSSLMACSGCCMV